MILTIQKITPKIPLKKLHEINNKSSSYANPVVAIEGRNPMQLLFILKQITVMQLSTLILPCPQFVSSNKKSFLKSGDNTVSNFINFKLIS